MEEEEDKVYNNNNIWLPFNNIVETQVDLISSALTSLTSPILSLFPNKPPPPPQPQHATTTNHQQNNPKLAVLRRIGYGLLGAVYTGIVLTTVLAMAVLLGVLVVNCWVEEPVFMKERVYFDYTVANPEAVAVVVAGGDKWRKVESRVPVGHRVHVSVVLLVPDSDYNRDLGVFQIMAEVVSKNGRITSRSSQPTMFQFQSHPIRLMRTFLMSLPLILGLTRETQKIAIPILTYKEDSLSRTEAIKVTLIPRSGTSNLPQLYEAEIVMHSKLPKMKELVHSWKWTFIVWVSLYIYIVLLLLVFCFFKPLLTLPGLRSMGLGLEPLRGVGSAFIGDERLRTAPRERGFAETLKKWQQYRRKRKAELLSKSLFAENVEPSSSVSSNTEAKEEDHVGPDKEGEVIDDNVVESQSSVC